VKILARIHDDGATLATVTVEMEDNRRMLRRVLLAALVCLAVWASGQASGSVTASSSATGLHSFDGHGGHPARSTDVWQSAGAVVTVQAHRLHGHPAVIPAATPAPTPRVRHAVSSASRRPPPAPHMFDLPLLI